MASWDMLAPLPASAGLCPPGGQKPGLREEEAGEEVQILAWVGEEVAPLLGEEVEEGDQPQKAEVEGVGEGSQHQATVVVVVVVVEHQATGVEGVVLTDHQVVGAEAGEEAEAGPVLSHRPSCLQGSC